MGYITLARKGNTSIRFVGDDTIVRYHFTDIVVFDRQRVILDSNGWRTATMKARMNDVADTYKFNFYIYQKNFVWYVGFWDNLRNDIPFVDGMEIRR